MSTKFSIHVHESAIKMRLDAFLQDKMHISRNQIQKDIKKKQIILKNKKTTSHAIVKKGDIIQINMDKPTADNTLRSKKITKNPTLKIIYEDAHMLVINKPAGIAVQKSENNKRCFSEISKEITIEDWLQSNMHCEQKSDMSKNFTIPKKLGAHLLNTYENHQNLPKSGLVHRLDKDTSGVLIAAKDLKTHSALSKQFENRTVTKIYLALIKGHITPKKGSIEAPLTRSRKDRKKIAVSASKKARFALTHYEVIDEFENCSLVKVHIVTGRTHQIRVHFQSIGYPVIGDRGYGDSKINTVFEKKYGLKRQFLHAFMIKIQNPSTGLMQTFYADVPKDLRKILGQTNQKLIS
ncbi:RluA family pseudouridine synthase [Candidatus Peregrinibacteria bacterium]|nr:RluA family pseudouridine synthase [Candidatus Peregrinibacteria bacterium]